MRIGRILQFKSIHTNIALAFSFLIFCTTFILSFNTYRISSDAVTNNSLEYTAQLIDQVKTNIQTYIQNMNSISDLALSNADLKRYLSMEDPNAPEGHRLAEQISAFFQSIVQSRKDIASILFIGSNDRLVSDRTNPKFRLFADLREQEWYKKAAAAQGKLVISSSHVQHLYSREYQWVVTISRQLTGYGGDDTGVLLVDLNYSVINDLCKQIHLGKRGYVFVLDPSGDLIYHPQQQLIYSKLKSEEIPAILASKEGSFASANGEKMYTIGTTEFGWKIVGVTYADELVGNKKEIRMSSAIWGLLCLVMALTVSVIFSFTLTKPIKKLETTMKQVEKGHFDIRVDIESTNEIGKLARTFNLMIGRIRELMNQIVEEQEKKRISELKALQAQIQPHFLYNTLDSIIWMAEVGKMENVVIMTSALAKLLRSSISKGEELVPLSVELEHVENYLTIQSIRYRNKFTYSIQVDEAILSCKILKIVLQPLVENAVYHGMKHKSYPGHIRITGRKQGSVIEIKVADDGLGIEPGRLEMLLAKGKRPEEGKKSLGLQNINDRIQLYFGEQYGLTVESEPEEGTTVTLRIPELNSEVEA